MIGLRIGIMVVQCIIVGSYWYRQFIVGNSDVSFVDKVWLFITSYAYCVTPGRFIGLLLVSYQVDHETLVDIMLWRSFHSIDILLPLVTSILMSAWLYGHSKTQTSVSERKVYGFVGFSILIYLLVSYLFVIRMAFTIVQDRLLFISILCLIIGMFTVFSKYHIQRAWHDVIETYSGTDLDLDKIRRVIGRKEAIMMEMVNDLREELPMDRDETQACIEEIKKQAFIKIGFSEDDILNALIFQYYIRFLDSNIELTTRVTPKLNIDSTMRAGKTYQCVEAWLSYCESLEARRITQVNLEIIRYEDRLQIIGQVEGKFERLEVERRRLVDWKNQVKQDIPHMNHLSVGISPHSIEIETII